MSNYAPLKRGLLYLVIAPSPQRKFVASYPPPPKKMACPSIVPPPKKKKKMVPGAASALRYSSNGNLYKVFCK